MRHDLQTAVRALAPAAALVAALAGCDKARESLLAADDPDIISPSAVQSAEKPCVLSTGGDVLEPAHRPDAKRFCPLSRVG